MLRKLPVVVVGRPPVPFVPTEKPSEVVAAATLEGVAQLGVAVLQVLICCFVAAEQVLMVAEKEEDEQTEGGGQSHNYYREYLSAGKAVRLVF